MCLAVPARIIELEDDKAVADAMGNKWNVRTTLIPDLKVGDFVLVHAGFAISTLDEKEARETWDLFKEIEEFDDNSNRVSG
ncbi:Hydrogenase isoenzymes formation protein HypC [Anaerohalosphaera lusitana]|uniref:Hydrogenase isoenzymes formation protein HypC n=1 Tax=Anaerohalosphaera lusitana TaxID=1936003 RepID=A0A1U9NIJ1_9BACT|nr:HypC/HybG/HupF family hydrogenase formation chaperone [Anaerohalosphaera lusitana]AQT67544.1 Hydrogenase isoenzymes formation protein HypC [Anaerohalosphaera lusitana]